MAVYTLDWSETNLGGSAIVSYASGAILDFNDKPATATSALSLTPNRGDSINVTIAEFSIETSGSSVMTFDYHTSTESGFDFLHIDVDGVSQASFSGATAWTSHAGINIASAGVHTIRFRYQKDGSGVGGEDRVWVALLNITNTVTTNNDTGSTDLYDMESGTIPSVASTSTWTNSTSEPITGTRSLRSPAAPANSGSYDLDITKPATTGYRPVGFDWKVSSEAGWDKLYIFPDSSAASVPASGQPSTPGAPGWLDRSGTASGRFAVILPAAASTLRLRYAKDAGTAVGSDAAWIDTLRVGKNASTTTVGASRATTWNTKARITPTRATTWRVRATLSVSRATTWDVLTSTAASRATTWRVRATATAQRSTTWNVASSLTTVGASRATTWRVRASVAPTRATTWNVKAVVAPTRQTTWRVKATVAPGRSTTWRVLTSVAPARSTTWRVRTTVSAQRPTTWNVLSSLVTVVSSRSTTWRVRQSITAIRTTTWTVGGTSYFFSPPTHEEPIRVNPQGPFRVLAYHRMTYAKSLIKVGGTWSAVRVPAPEVVAGLQEGTTFFRGGYEYVIDYTTAQSLIAAGYSPRQL